jgi:hypothetical protein
MNPYFERDAVWYSFHQTFLTNLREQLVNRVGRDLLAKLEVLRFVRSMTRENRPIYGNHRFIEIRAIRTKQLVTTIELACMSNKKPGPDRDAYLRRRKEILKSAGHLVEIDLLRDGKRHAGLRGPNYHVLISRADKRPEQSVIPFKLRDPLPEIAVPLSPFRSDVIINLKSALDRVYDVIGCVPNLYDGSPEPPLSAKDAEWAMKFLPKQRC